MTANAASAPALDVARANRVWGGVDLGGTKIRVGLADAEGTVCGETEQLTLDAGARLGEQIAAMVDELRARTGLHGALAGIGIGGAGVDTGDGGFALAPNLAGLAGRDVAAEVAAAVGAPAVLDNDVNMAALGELHAGSAGDDFCFISFGTGVGMGIVSEGRLIRGARGAAGEIGYLPLGRDPFDPAVHESGAFEAEVGGPVVGERMSAAIGHSVSTREVFDMAAAGDPYARGVLDSFARWAAQGIAAVAAVLDPAVVVLGGGLGRRPDLADLIRPWLSQLGHPHIDLRTSASGPSGPIAGAIRRARDVVPQEGPRP